MCSHTPYRAGALVGRRLAGDAAEDEELGRVCHISCFTVSSLLVCLRRCTADIGSIVGWLTTIKMGISYRSEWSFVC